MFDLAIFLPLFIMGLVSSAHCIGMCGGIMGALTMAIPAHAKTARWMILVAYNLGRICSYTFRGILVGLFAEQFAALGGGAILRVLAGTLLITMGLYLADWWRGLTRLETVGRYLWVYIQPLGKRLMPVDSLSKALLLGALWGWLPCGLVYSALAMAMTQPASLLAGTAMLAFGLGTLPAVLAAGFAVNQLTRVMQQREVRIGLALIIIVFGLWTMWGAFVHAGHHHGAAHLGQPGAVAHAIEDHASNHVHISHSATSFSSAALLERQRTDIKNHIPENYQSVESQDSSAASSHASDASATHIHQH